MSDSNITSSGSDNMMISVAAPVHRRKSPQRATKLNNQQAREENMFCIAKLGGEVGEGKTYNRVDHFVLNPNFDPEKCKESKDSMNKNVGQFVAKLLLNRGDHWVWRRKSDGEFVTFKSNCETKTSDMYDIDPLIEGKEKFTSFEALGEWAHQDGFYENKMVNSREEEVQKFLLDLGLIEEEEEERGCKSKNQNRIEKRNTKVQVSMKRGGDRGALGARKRMKAKISGRLGNTSNSDQDDLDFESDEEVQHTSNTKKTAVVDKSSESSGDDDKDNEMSGFGDDDDDDTEDDPQGRGENNGRSFFSPPVVSDELANASRGCVKACLAFLGYEGDIQDITPSKDPRMVQWDEVLKSVCPEAIILPFNSARDLTNLPHETLDGLIVATVNKKPKEKTTNHAMVIWKKDNTQLGNTKVELFDPGNPNVETRRTVDLAKERRATANWNMICAAFLSGTPVFENGTNSESDAIDLCSSSSDEKGDSDEESGGDEKPAATTDDNTKKQATEQIEEDPTSSDEKSDSDKESGGDKKLPAKDGSDNTKNQAAEQTEELDIGSLLRTTNNIDDQWLNFGGC